MGHAVTEGDQVRRRRLQRYLNEGLGRVEGWLDARSAKVIAALGEYQAMHGIHGAVGEIGVHHGKLLVLLDLLKAKYAGQSYDERELSPIFDDPTPVIAKVLRRQPSAELVARLMARRGRRSQTEQPSLERRQQAMERPL